MSSRLLHLVSYFVYFLSGVQLGMRERKIPLFACGTYFLCNLLPCMKHERTRIPPVTLCDLRREGIILLKKRKDDKVQKNVNGQGKRFDANSSTSSLVVSNESLLD